jgi:hypothetical protein
MEASHATDCARWMSDVDPNGAKDRSGAIATLADFPVFDATVQRVIALCDDENATTVDLVEALECDRSFSANLTSKGSRRSTRRTARAWATTCSRSLHAL